MAAKIGCSKCNKSSLSLLLLRPSPIANNSAIAPVNSALTGIISAEFASILPSRMPTESHFALRLLRAGYVHVYIPSPPAGVPEWLIFRVTEQADLIPEDSGNFKKKDPSIVCFEPPAKHNGTGLKLLSIPQAHRIPEIWIGFSANLWNKQLRAQNIKRLIKDTSAAKTSVGKPSPVKPSPMQNIKLAGGSTCTFSPTVENLKQQVLECSLKSLVTAGDTDTDFKFSSLVGEPTVKLCDNLIAAAACHPDTKNKQLAVVLSDPVGIATELNSTRIRRAELLKQFIALPENSHPLMSQNATKGIRENILAASNQQSLNEISPLMLKDDAKASTVKTATFYPLTEVKDIAAANEKYKGGDPTAIRMRHAIKMGLLGRFYYPDQKARMTAWAIENARETWEEMSKFYDEEDRQNWTKKFNEEVKQKHYDSIEKHELDWRGAVTDATMKAYFSTHFDEHDPNDPANFHSPGLAFMQEVYHISQPAPITTGKVRDEYMKQITAAASEEDSIVQRALTGNHIAWRTALQKSYTSAGKKVEGNTEETGMEDKVYDILTAYHIPGKLSFMTDGFAFMGLGLATALTTAAISAAAHSPAPAWVFRRLQHFYAVAHGIEYVRAAVARGALHDLAPKVPVIITFTLHGQDALDYRQAREIAGKNTGIGENQLRARITAGEAIQVYCLTDTETVRNLPDQNLVKAAKGGTLGDLKMGPAATIAIQAAKGKTAIFNEAALAAIFLRQQDAARDAVSYIRTAAATPTGQGMTKLVSTLDGRLAMGSLMVQMLGVYYNSGNLNKELNKAEREKDQNKILAAKLNLADSLVGMTGAMAEIYGLVATTASIASVGAHATSLSWRLTSTKVIANFTGVAGGFINFIACNIQRDDAKAKGDDEVATLYQSAAIAFLATAAPAALMIAGTIAEAIVARTATNTVATMVATRLGAAGAGAAVGLTVTGVGFFLLLAGVSLQIAAIMLTPSDLQRWLARSYFGRNRKLLGMGGGRREDSFPLGNWMAEFEGLLKAYGTSLANEEAKRLSKIEKARTGATGGNQTGTAAKDKTMFTQP